MTQMIMTRKEFNANWIAKVRWQEINTLLGYESLIALLDDAAPKTMERLSRCKAEKLVVKPFHGAVVTFYCR